MIFIFGTKGRAVKKGEGRFFCPHCGGERNYKQYKLSTYFTLFFIPTFPIQKIADYVECDACSSQYHLDVLNETAEKVLLRSIYADGIAGMPLQMITNKLMNNGLNQFEADAAVQKLANDVVQKNCTSCHLTYLADANLQTCTSCGAELR